MAQAVKTFYLKFRDTRPILRVRLREADGQPHDLTGATDVALHVRLAGTTTVLSRTMTIENVTDGIVTYTWLSTDWAPVVETDPKLVVGLHDMEYEVRATDNARATFPNHQHDKLSIFEDLGQATA